MQLWVLSVHFCIVHFICLQSMLLSKEKSGSEYQVCVFEIFKLGPYIYVTALLWGWGLLLCMFMVVHEQLYGPYPTKNVMIFAVAYGPYIIMPLVVMVRVARTPLFEQTQPTRGDGGSGQKKRNKKD